MVTQQIIDKWLPKNVSYLFSLPLFNTPFNNVLKDYVVNTYLYNYDNDYFAILLKYECINILENNINNIPHYKEHIECGDYIIVYVDRVLYIEDCTLKCLETSNYSNIKNCMIYKGYMSNGKVQKPLDDKSTILQKHIIEENEVLNALLQVKFKTNVNGYWKRFNIEEETLTLEKIKDMNTGLEIRKDWLLSKIKNADILSKIAYEDVLFNSKEIGIPNVTAMGKQDTIDYEGIYNKVKDALIKKCGKPQYKLPPIQGGKGWDLMVGFQIFQDRLSKAIIKYKLTDINKVEELLCRHVSSLSYPQLQYYISKQTKDGPVSQLYTDYDCYVESKPVVNTQTFEI